MFGRKGFKNVGAKICLRLFEEKKTFKFGIAIQIGRLQEFRIDYPCLYIIITV